MTSKPKDMALEDLMRRSHELERRVLELQKTLSQLRAEMEQALSHEALASTARRHSTDGVPTPTRRRRTAVSERASQKAD